MLQRHAEIAGAPRDVIRGRAEIETRMAEVDARSALRRLACCDRGFRIVRGEIEALQ